METIIITKKRLEYYSRIDADFYKNEYTSIINHLKKIKNTKIVKLRHVLTTNVRTGSTPSPLNRIPLNDGTDVLFIKTNPVREGYINYDVVNKLPIKEHEKRKLTALNYGDVVVTVVGATHDIVGRAAVYLLNFHANINQGIVILKINSKLVLPGFISTYINSKYGRTQFWKYSGQTEQVTLNSREVEQVIIPILSMDIQKNIHDAVIKSEKLRNESKRLYDIATKTLADEIGLSNLKLNLQRCFVINSKKLSKEKIFEPTYFKKLVLPILTPKTQTKLSTILNKSFKMRKESIELLDINKSKIEKIIKNIKMD